MTSLPPPMCYSCRHLRADPQMICDAFPNGIPTEIVESVVDHRDPYTGDNNIQFEQDPRAPVPHWDMLGFAEVP